LRPQTARRRWTEVLVERCAPAIYIAVVRHRCSALRQ
jgi:hypothetical protein